MAGKGDKTRAEILEVALNQASLVGLEGLSIGELAKEVGMSKSGLFAHFGSKSDLQLAVIELAASLFIETVIRPAIGRPRGEPRLRALFENWATWSERAALDGGCVIASTSWEVDDRPGPVRDQIDKTLSELHQTIERAAKIAIEEGHFVPETDVQQFAFEMHAVMLGHHVHWRLFRRPDALARARRAFERLLEDRRPS